MTDLVFNSGMIKVLIDLGKDNNFCLFLQGSRISIILSRKYYTCCYYLGVFVGTVLGIVYRLAVSGIIAAYYVKAVFGGMS